MTHTIKTIWFIAAVIWLAILARGVLAAEATLPVRATLIVAESPEDLAELLNEITPAASDTSAPAQHELHAAPDDDQEGGFEIQTLEVNYE